MTEIRDAVYEVELKRGVVVSILLTTMDEWDRPVVRGSPFRKEVERDAIAL